MERASAFDSRGLARVIIPEIHASPSKLTENTVRVEAAACPPSWVDPKLAEDGSSAGPEVQEGGGGSADQPGPGEIN